MSTTELLDRVEEDRREIVALARDFARREIAPHAADWDRAGDYPREILRSLADLGFFGMLIPEAYGGLGLDVLTYLMVLEELAAADAGTSITVSIHNSLASGMLLRHGTEVQKARWLKPMAAGELLAAFALSEPDSGSDAASLRTQADRVGDDWVINGAKAWVTNGDLADVVFTMVRTDTPAQRRGSRGISAFLVPASTPGYAAGKREDKLGLRASHTTALALKDVRLTDAHLLGEEGRGFTYALESLDSGRMGVASQAIGIARAAFDASISYSSERRQFDRPLRDFQAIQFKLADMATRIAAARALLKDTVRARERGQRVTGLASMAKLFASESAVWVTNQAVQIFGGYGYMRDFPVERLFRDAKVTEIYEGTSEVQRIVIARHLQQDHEER